MPPHLARPSDRNTERTSADRDGFTLVEALLASLIVLAVAVSTIPMFTRALANNAAGMDSTKVSNLAEQALEGLLELPFNDPALTLATGTTSRIDEEYFSALGQTWMDYPLPGSLVNVLYTRRTTVRQYALQALDDGRLEVAEALEASAPPSAIHMKEIEVRVEQQGSATGPAKKITLRTLKVR